MSGARLGLVVVTAAACFFAGRTVLGSQLAAAAESERLALPPLPAEGRRDLALVHVEGEVERGTAEKGFAKGAEGESLGAGETLRVGGGAGATLRLGVASSLELSAGGEVTAVSASASEIALRLDAGRARVALAHPGRTLRVTSPDGAEVIAAGGPSTRFLVAVHPGRLAVFNDDEAASVRLIAAGAEVEVPARRVSWSVRGAAPRPPIEPPSDPGLEIVGAAFANAPPGEEAAGDGLAAKRPTPTASPNGVDPNGPGALVVVKGRAHPLALVKVGGALVEVQADGSFEAGVPKMDAPYAVLASLPTGSEALLEVPLPGAASADTSNTSGHPPAGAPDRDDEAAEPPAEPVVAQAEEPPPKEPPAVEKPKPAPKPKARKKRRVQRQKPAQKPKPPPSAQKAEPAKKKSGAVTWGAPP